MSTASCAAHLRRAAARDGQQRLLRLALIEITARYASGPGITCTGPTPGCTVMPGMVVMPPGAHGSTGAQHWGCMGAHGRAACWRGKQFGHNHWHRPQESSTSTLRIASSWLVSPHGIHGEGCGVAQLYTARFVVQGSRVVFLQRVAIWRHARRKGATFYGTRAATYRGSCSPSYRRLPAASRMPPAASLAMPADRSLRQRTIEFCRFAASLVALALLQILFSAACQGAIAELDARPALRDSDEVWLVSSRGLGCNAEQNVGNLKYWHYDREQSWTRSSLDALRATDSTDAVTVVFVHGYRIDHCEAFTKGWSAYRALTRCAGERAVRFVIWSWPSTKTCGPIEDARMKAARTDVDGYYLAWFVDQLGPQVPVSLWGHSYGARVSPGRCTCWAAVPWQAGEFHRSTSPSSGYCKRHFWPRPGRRLAVARPSTWPSDTDR